MAIGKKSQTYTEQRRAEDVARRAEIVRAYQNGRKLHELVKAYRLPRWYIIRALNAHGADVHQTGTKRRIINVEQEHAHTARLAAIAELYASGQSLQTIADAFDITLSKVYGMLDRAGIPRRPRGRPRKHREVHPRPVAIPPLPNFPTEADVIRLYESGLNVQRVADTLGVAPTAVRRTLTNNNVPCRPRGRPKLPPSDRHLQIAAAYRSGKTMEAIGKEMGLTRERVRQLLAKVSEPSRHAGVIGPRFSSAQAAQASDLYREGKSMAVVATTVGVCADTVRKMLIFCSVPIRKGGTYKRSVVACVRERHDAIVQMYQDGMMVDAIAQRIQMSKPRVWQVLQKRGVTLRPRGKGRANR